MKKIDYNFLFKTLSMSYCMNTSYQDPNINAIKNDIKLLNKKVNKIDEKLDSLEEIMKEISDILKYGPLSDARLEEENDFQKLSHKKKKNVT